MLQPRLSLLWSWRRAEGSQHAASSEYRLSRWVADRRGCFLSGKPAEFDTGRSPPGPGSVGNVRRQHPPNPSPETAPRAAPASSELADIESKPAGQSEHVSVVGAGTEGVNLRRKPGTAGARLKGLFDGVELDVIGPDRQVDGRAWRTVRDPADRSEGWMAAEFLA